MLLTQEEKADSWVRPLYTVADRIMAPEDADLLIPGTCDYVYPVWQKGLSDAIKDTEMGRLLWIIQIGPM